MILLDTDTIIYFPKGERAVVKRLESALNLGIATTIINHSELLFGAYHSQRKVENLKHSSKIDGLVIETWRGEVD